MILKDHKKLERLMVVQGVSHRQLATAAGYKAHSHVSRLVRGEARHVATDAALRIAHQLRVAVEDLFLPEETSNSGRKDHKRAS
ncbi:helix-turn-helix transcriptional regulator [Nocardia gipuzkoensis]|uniref:helix-turn-helix domain-containing protein n=1 Tax=Nocardia gipuzkoensis TaxID=2749991 RepID=UPI001E55F95C|nr:helix-turn-helix transcriptional regulator [Nocardia gipuzkoensis]UGT71858.1 helix-turn-helix transcriptional regulator [Nocardia gipuzkoensis]